MHDLQRAERSLARLDERLTERIVPWQGGVAHLHSGLSKLWDLNLMVLEDGSLGAGEIASAADDVMGGAGCHHRRVLVRDPKVGARLEPGFRELGWNTDVHVIMGHVREPDREVDCSSVHDVGSATWPGREEQLRTYAWADEEAIEQLRTLYDLITGLDGVRDFAVMKDGKAVSFALLISDGSTGQIEDVATLTAYRNQGLSRRVMTKALEESRASNDFTFLVADDRDWPKRFYSKLGFDVLGRHYYFLRIPNR